MNQSEQNRAIIAFLERLKQEWPWLQHIYIVQGSPLKPKDYQSIVLDTRQSAILKNVALESNVQKLLDYQQAAVWIEAIQPRSDRITNLTAWIIGMGLRETSWIYRIGNVQVVLDKNKATAESLSRLETSFTRSLIPPSGKRMGCSPLLSERGRWSWWNERMLWVITGKLNIRGDSESTELRYIELSLEREMIRQAQSIPLKSQFFNGPWQEAIQLSPQGQYLSWPESDKPKWRVVQSVKGGNLLTRVALPEEQHLFHYTWIDDTHWVEYRYEKHDFVVDIYDVNHTEKIRSYKSPGPIGDSMLEHIGLSEKGELALVGNSTASRDGKVKIYCIDLKRQSLRTSVVPVPEHSYASQITMSPNGRWIAWHIPVRELDPFFIRGAVWVSRVDGSGARKVTDVVDAGSGTTADGFRVFRWRQDGAALASIWDHCLYSFPI